MKSLNEVGKKGDRVKVEIFNTNCPKPVLIDTQEMELFEPIKSGGFIKKTDETKNDVGVAIGNTISSINQSDEYTNVFIIRTVMYKSYTVTFTE